MDAQLLIVGVNHRWSPVEVRERLAVQPERVPDFLQRVAESPAIEEAAVLSTCNRVETVVVTRHLEDAAEAVVTQLSGEDRCSPRELEDNLLQYRGREAVRHLFRVAASLDSMVVGEPQILGQMKDFYRRAAAAGTIGVVLHRCFHKAFAVAKRVRTETGIASRAVSVSSAAVELASKVFDRLDDKTALLIGAGTMGELAARHLLSHGVRGLLVINRSFERAVAVAKQFAGTPMPWDELPQALIWADVVVGSTAAEGFVLKVETIREALRQRKFRPLFLIDLSVPRNFDPQINQIDQVYLFDIDDLSAVAEQNRGQRAIEAEQAELIVEAEVDAFMRWLRSLDAVPTIVALRERVEALRQQEVQRFFASHAELSAEARREIDAFSRALIAKFLHGPLTEIKRLGSKREKLYLAAARRLFHLDQETDEE
ncbi:MAG: glutamyl-tRNA reductase [Candidatus Binatia bacterium]|nr:MAG: glutamyl-tRNA reductase [Candidatus Binatia bacterium]